MINKLHITISIVNHKSLTDFLDGSLEMLCKTDL